MKKDPKSRQQQQRMPSTAKEKTHATKQKQQAVQTDGFRYDYDDSSNV
ncbi:hypothetical protein [Halalkalibacter okhensis]|nr:hypothetical protein [Halalkalibacter okhensis]